MMSSCIISLPHLASESVMRLPRGHDVWHNMQLLAQRDKWLFPEAKRPSATQFVRQILVLRGGGCEGGHSDPPEGLQTSVHWQLLLRNLQPLGSPAPKVSKCQKPHRAIENASTLIWIHLKIHLLNILAFHPH